MAHPDQQAAQPVIDPKHVDNYIVYELPVLFTITRARKEDREGQVTVRHYEDGTITLAFEGVAIHELERRDKRGVIGR